MDFSILTNDQLVEMIRAACAEAGSRGQATVAAAQAAMLSESEKVDIARVAAEREALRLKQAEAARIAEAAAEEVRRQAGQTEQQQAAAKQAKIWGMQKTLAQGVQAVFGRGCTLTVWQKDGEKRVYIDREGSGRRASAEIRVEYYATGNHRNAPGALSVDGKDAAGTAEEKTLAQILVEKASKEWNAVRLDCNQSVDSQTEAVGTVSAEFLAYQSQREAAAKAEAEELARVSAEKADEAAQAKQVKAERLAQEKAERQERLRALIGGMPVWAKNHMPVATECLQGAGQDYGLRTVIVGRTEEGFLRVVSVLIVQSQIMLKEVLTEPVGFADLPQSLTRLFDEEDRAVLGDVATAAEIEREAFVAANNSFYSAVPSLRPTRFAGEGWSTHMTASNFQTLTATGVRQYDYEVSLPCMSEALKDKMGLKPQEKKAEVTA